MSEEWGPWIEHDKRGCPVADGTWVIVDCRPHGEDRYQSDPIMIGRDYFASDWDRVDRYTLGMPEFGILRYRIRKPRGLTILEEIAQGVKQPEDA